MPGGNETVFLNGFPFAIEGEIRTQTIDPWPDALRNTGQKQRNNRINASQWIQESWRTGIGWYKHVGIPPDDVGGGHPSFDGVFDSTAETRWEGQTTLPGLITSDMTLETTTFDYYRFFTGPTAGVSANRTSPYLVSFTGAEHIERLDDDGAEWSSSKDLSGGTYANFAPRVFISLDGDIHIYGGLIAGTVPARTVKLQPDGTYADRTFTTNFSGIPYGGVAVNDSDMYVVAIDTTNGLLTIEKSTDKGVTWAIVDKQTFWGYRWADMIMYLDADGKPAPYVVTDKALYLLNLSTDLLEKVMDMPEIDSTAFKTFSRCQVWNGDLYIPKGQSLIQFNFTGNWRDISPLATPGRRVSSDYLSSAAHWTALHSHSDWLFCAVSGGSNGRVFAWDGQGFHYIYGVSGKFIADIVVSHANTASTTTQENLYISTHVTNGEVDRVEDVLLNPLENSSHIYATSAVIITPFFDAGMSEVDAAVIAVGGQMIGLDSGNEEVKVETELDYSGSYDATANRIVTFTADTDQFLKYVAGAGFSSRAWRHKYTLSRGSTTTNSPVIFFTDTYYRKKPTRIHEFGFLINLEESIHLSHQQYANDLDKVMTELHNAEESIPLVELKISGKTAITDVATGSVLYVDIENIPASHRGSREYSWLPEIISGTALVVARQIF